MKRNGQMNGEGMNRFRLNLVDDMLPVVAGERPSFFFEYPVMHQSPDRPGSEGPGVDIWVGCTMGANTFDHVTHHLMEEVYQSDGLMNEDALRNVIEPYIRLEVVNHG